MGTWSWFKIDTDGWLQGSIRIDLTPEQRGIWIDLLALASNTRLRDGTLRFAPDKPMPRDWIANNLRIPLESLNSTITACQLDKNKEDGRSRIEVWDDGTIEITNFARYQAIPPEKTRPREDSRARELRERHLTRQLAKQYPDEAQDALPIERKDNAEKP